MSFDIALGINQAQLDAGSKAVYAAIYPGPFKGTQDSSYKSVDYTVAWDVKAAPTFDLSKPASADAVTDLLTDRLNDSLAMPMSADDPKAVELKRAIPLLAAETPSFTVSFSEVDITLSSKGAPTTTLKLPFSAQCTAEISGDKLTFTVMSVSAAPQQDPVQQYLVTHVVDPALKTALQSIFSSTDLPPISVGSVSIATPSVGIVNDSVILASNLAAAGTPPPPDGTFPWPSDNFFALLGPNMIQAQVEVALASATNKFSDHGSGGDDWAGYHWGYGLSLTNPHTSIQGTDVAGTFTLNGDVSAGVKIVFVPIGLGFNAHATPDPSVVIDLQISGSKVNLVTASVNPFTIVVSPTGSIPAKVVGWLISAIIDGVVTSLTPLVTGFLKGINVDSFDIPTATVSIDGKNITMTPTGLGKTNVGGYLGVVGNVTISS
ncbi:MAG: hypothetical protein NXI16_05290 [Alphaproteobacteria bacterium]|nr:hypothetical protein [Alphaproteobacteria bacterium]